MMPTKCESSSNVINSNSHSLCSTWIKDLKSCPLTGIGHSVGQVYEKNETRSDLSFSQEMSFHLLLDEKINPDTCLYGVLHGFNGIDAAQFVSYYLPCEIVFNKLLKLDETDETIILILRQAFLDIEKEYYLFKSDLFALKADYEYKLQDRYELENVQKFSHIATKLKQLEERLNSGTTAVVSLLLKNRFFVANIGNCRAIICNKDNNDHMIFQQLTHDSFSSNEPINFKEMEKNIRSSQNSSIESNKIIRCIGNYLTKRNFKNSLSNLESSLEPIMAEPEIVGPVTIDERSQFLLLFSDGLYKALKEATNTGNVNHDIVQMVIEEFKEQSTLFGVAQAVVNRVCKLHQDKFLSGNSSFQKIDDITLLVRLFHHPWMKGPWNGALHSSSSSVFNSLSVDVENLNVNKDDIPLDNYPLEMLNPSNFDPSSESLTEGTLSSSESDSHNGFIFHSLTEELEKDAEGKIAAYVDFEDFHKALKESEDVENLLQFNLT